MAEKHHVIPPARVRYLAEIVESSRAYDAFVEEQVGIARRMYQLHGTIELLRAEVGSERVEIVDTGESDVVEAVAHVEGEPAYLEDLVSRYHVLEERLDHSCRKALADWPDKVKRYRADKYRFKVEPLCAPDGLLVEDGRLVGLRFRRTKIEKGRVVMQDETFEVRAPAIVSSIGSIPEPIEGIEMNGELFDFKDWDIGKLEGYPTVFSVGNVVTGKGNIVASRKHATQVSKEAIEAYLGIADENADRVDAAPADAGTEAASKTANQVIETLTSAEALNDEEAKALVARVSARQREVGFQDYKSWREEIGDPC